MAKYAVIFLAWGDRCISEVSSCLAASGAFLECYDRILITDETSNIQCLEGQVTKVIRANFQHAGLLRKTEVFKFLPKQYDAFLFLDSDTIVVQDISLGFNKADTYGIAASPAPHYSLDAFWQFDLIMGDEGAPKLGQLQYNTGVIFFNGSDKVKEVFEKWGALGLRYADYNNDQPFFTLAMEQLEFNPYTLSISYNYRAIGDAISGDVRIWHSRGEIPDTINQYESSWPLRRAWPGRIET